MIGFAAIGFSFRTILRGQYAGASPACQLHCERTYPASTAMDQHALAANEMRMFEERLPSG
jgi:hypothetical protein